MLTLRILLVAVTMVLLTAPVAASAATIESPAIIIIPAGPFITGSDAREREAAYGLDERAYGHNRTRTARWYENERDRKVLETGTYGITRTLITNVAYAAFVRTTGHPSPDVDRVTWDSYGLIHPFERTRRHAWNGSAPPSGREDHPVVLVSHDDAMAYAQWLSVQTGRVWRLPSEEEWEKAARGTDGQRFPWGDNFDETLLNSHDAGPFDTTAVGAFPGGASSYGLLDAAGQVFEWTASTYSKGRFVVKGGSWDDRGCGICRPSARHTRPGYLKHILIGFRLVTTDIPDAE